jgi:hypothetical protein
MNFLVLESVKKVRKSIEFLYGFTKNSSASTMLI